MGEIEPGEYWERRIKKDMHTNHSGYNDFYNHYLYKLKLAKLKSLIKKYKIRIKDKKILDVGTGFGFFVDFFSQHNPKMIKGIDVSQTAVDYLSNKFPNYLFEKTDISQKNVLKGEYDIINASDVMYHLIDDSKFKQTLIEFRRVAKKGSYLFITDRFGQKDQKIHDFMKVHSYKKYNSLLKGFQILEIKPIYNLLNRDLKLPKFISNYLAPFLYLYDLYFAKNLPNNLKILVARKC